MKSPYVVEVCCGSYEDAVAAEQGGASRIELNQALSLGGLTPSLSTLMITKKAVNLPVIVMVRPRGGGFAYSPMEYKVMLQDCRLFLEHGADGIAFGFLQEQSRKICVERTREFTSLIHSYGKEAVFHRAFDLVTDWEESIEALITCGVDRILTSGLQETAWEGRQTLAQMQARYGTSIELVAGSGVRSENVHALLEATRCTQVHSSCKGWQADGAVKSQYVSYEYTEYGSVYEVVDTGIVENLVKAVEDIEWNHE